MNLTENALFLVTGKTSLMAAERTLMAWTRSAVSLITFGFTLYKFLQYVRTEEAGEAIEARGPRNLAELEQIPGVGPAKLSRYGQEVLAVLGAAGGERRPEA